MKIAIVSESSADEAAIKILVDAIIGESCEVFPIRTRPNGWTRIFELLPNLIQGLHYGTDVEGLVVVMDSDESLPHKGSHDLREQNNLECRLCRLRITVKGVVVQLRAMPTRSILKIALGLAVPAIEAWYQAGLDSHVNEVAWSRKLAGEDVSYDKLSLKMNSYGSNKPNLEMETRAAIDAANRLASRLDMLEELFPGGFGSLKRDLRSWQGV